jgi:hypothetical protein
MGKKILIVLLLIAGAIGFGVWKLTGVFSRASKAGDQAIAEFHTRFNAAQDQEIHQAAAPAFQQSTSLATLQEVNKYIREKLGKFQSSERTGLNVNTTNGHTTLTVEYGATYEKGAATEKFVFDYNSDKPLLLSFDVKSPTLITPAPNPALPAVPANDQNKPTQPEVEK